MSNVLQVCSVNDSSSDLDTLFKKRWVEIISTINIWILNVFK